MWLKNRVGIFKAMIWSYNGSLVLDPKTNCLADTPYCPCLYNISVHTQGNSHLSCVELAILQRNTFDYRILTDGITRTDEDGNHFLYFPLLRKFNCGMTIYSNGFTVYARWVSGHSPYPSIDKMTIDAFGVRVIDNESFPKAPNDYKHVCTITRDRDDGTISVNYTPISSPHEDDLQ